MDGSTTDTPPRVAFRSPARILIPKLAHSRDQWKAKSDRRKRLLKQAQIRCRDLTLSRQRWKDRALAAEPNAPQLQQQLDAARQQLESAHAQIAELQDAVQKKISLPRS